MHLLLAHPFLAFLAWTLCAVAFGLALGKVIAHADDVERERLLEQVNTETQVIYWADRPASWL